MLAKKQKSNLEEKILEPLVSTSYSIFRSKTIVEVGWQYVDKQISLFKVNVHLEPQN